MKLKFKLFIISLFVGFIIMFAFMQVIDVSAFWVRDVCWIENYLDIDFTVCEVPGGIYVLTPTPTPTVRVRNNMGYPAPPDDMGYPAPSDNTPTPYPTFTPRPTPTYAPTLNPYGD